jgi:hypothetical protein
MTLRVVVHLDVRSRPEGMSRTVIVERDLWGDPARRAAGYLAPKVRHAVEAVRL